MSPWPGVRDAMPELALCYISVEPLAIADVVVSAAAAGFDGVSILSRTLRRAVERDGLSTSAIRALVADQGLVITDGASRPNWARQRWSWSTTARRCPLPWRRSASRRCVTAPRSTG